jgi:hypothetical protein
MDRQSLAHKVSHAGIDWGEEVAEALRMKTIRGLL